MEVLDVTDGSGRVTKVGRTQWRGQTLLHDAVITPHIGSLLDSLTEYKRRPDDVWIASYPKAGSNWTFEIVSILLSEKAEPYRRKKDTEMVEQYETVTELENTPSPRCLNTHINVDLLPDQVFNGKVIYLIRNPLSCALSLFNHVQKLPNRYKGLGGNKKEVLHNALYGKFPVMDTSLGTPVVGSWILHVPPWWKKHRDNPNVLFIFYEEMRKNTLAHVKKLASFLGKNCSEEFYQKVLEITTLENMKETSKRKEVSKKGCPVVDIFYHKGQIDEWKNHFSSDEVEEFMKFFRNELKDVPDLRDRIVFE